MFIAHIRGQEGNIGVEIIDDADGQVIERCTTAGELVMKQWLDRFYPGIEVIYANVQV